MAASAEAPSSPILFQARLRARGGAGVMLYGRASVLQGVGEVGVVTERASVSTGVDTKANTWVCGERGALQLLEHAVLLDAARYDDCGGDAEPLLREVDPLGRLLALELVDLKRVTVDTAKGRGMLSERGGALVSDLIVSETVSGKWRGDAESKRFGGGGALQIGDHRLVEDGGERSDALVSDAVASETASEGQDGNGERVGMSMGADRKANTCGCAASAHFSEVRLLHSGRHAAKAVTPERSIIFMSPPLSGAMLIVISRPS
eukprot:scaffold4697_cov58-Phaeocystis_antarctica.AAC.5